MTLITAAEIVAYLEDSFFSFIHTLPTFTSDVNSTLNNTVRVYLVGDTTRAIASGYLQRDTHFEIMMHLDSAAAAEHVERLLYRHPQFITTVVEDFEDALGGDWGEYNSARSSAKAYTGSFSEKMSGNNIIGDSLSYTSPGGAIRHVEYYFLFLNPTSGHNSFAYWDVDFGLHFKGDDQKLYHHDGTTTTVISDALTADTWYKIALGIDHDELYIELDDVALLEGGGIGSTSRESFYWNSGTSSTPEFYIDDVSIQHDAGKGAGAPVRVETHLSHVNTDGSGMHTYRLGAIFTQLEEIS
ncbi:hypothetical protein GF380_04370 [Candidatus Uhrbacteria bacterium]|nr:hypothetical protein [Candidatus Uhrbacteria bacterium]